jgi:hypothetical protein
MQEISVPLETPSTQTANYLLRVKTIQTIVVHELQECNPLNPLNT